MRETLIENFKRISSIPRESGHEEKVANFFIEIAKKNNLNYYKDSHNNVLIQKNGNKNTEYIALQAHLDMVCVKEKYKKHNFQKDGIDIIIEGDNVSADGTSLGADQGIGLAFMLTILESKNLNHPNLEFIFTTNEETTFEGAVNFPYEKISSRRLINLDNADDSTVVIGADGDICNRYRLKGKQITTDKQAYKIKISNISGGNSGENIEQSKRNAITTMATLLKEKEILLKSIQGGTSENDIATSCEIILNTELNIQDFCKKNKISIERIHNTICFDQKSTQNIINQILDLKCGYLTTDTSANLGCINTKENEVTIDYIIRSIKENELKELNKKTQSLNNNFHVQELYYDKIWEIDNHSKLLKEYRELYFEKYQKYPTETICHGGMEGSVFKDKIKELDMISIGSTIKDFHTTKETTFISSWIKIYECLIALLERI